MRAVIADLQCAERRDIKQGTGMYKQGKVKAPRSLISGYLSESCIKAPIQLDRNKGRNRFISFCISFCLRDLSGTPNGGLDRKTDFSS